MQIIQNENELFQHHAQFSSFNISMSALKKAMKSVDPVVLIKRAIDVKDNKLLVVRDVNDVKYFLISKTTNLFIFLVQEKQQHRMAKSLMETLNIEISSGAITIPYNEKVLPDKLMVIEAGHPFQIKIAYVEPNR